MSETETTFTRCRHILKTVKNVTVAKFEPAFTRHHFQFVPIRVPFSKSTVFKICLHKTCRFRFQYMPAQNVPLSCERKAFPSDFRRFKDVPASCEHYQRDEDIFIMEAGNEQLLSWQIIINIYSRETTGYIYDDPFISHELFYVFALILLDIEQIHIRWAFA